MVLTVVGFIFSCCLPIILSMIVSRLTKEMFRQPNVKCEDLIYQIRVEKNIELLRYDSPLVQMLYATIAFELI